MSQEILFDEIKTKSVKGIVVLTGRTFILQVISLFSQLVLFAYLGQYEFGVFAIVSSFVNFLVYFSDIGLAAALIQKKEEPNETDLKTTFTIQQILVLIIVVLAFFLSPFLVEKYSFDEQGKYLLYALSVSLFLSSLKSIPSVLLERKLEFIKLVTPQIIETLVYNLTVVIFAVYGFGIASFSFAVLIRSIVGLAIIYWIMPWIPGFSLSLKSVKELFKFGIPYQINTFLATFKDDGLILFLGSILGPSGVGILSFAQKIARYPLTFFMDSVTKVTFPAFSRLQNDKQALSKALTRSIFFTCFFVFPCLSGLSVVFPEIINLIPRYSKWASAYWPLLFVSFNFAFAAVTTQLTNMLNAISKIKVTFYFMILWTVLSWILIPFLSTNFGVNGASLGYSLVGASSVVAIIVSKRYLNFSIFNSIKAPLVGSAVMVFVLLISKKLLPANTESFYFLILIGIFAYAISMISIIGYSLIEDVKKSAKLIFSK